ncbi:MAG TPA: xanthine dehydrogenase family protein subunit M [Thermomicrobiales bacterium]|nr:xanthine dehydrogenase family protein subunit M [Thermomicrobiales bacterium]
MRPFAYARPETIGQALTVLDHQNRPLAGGTDLLTLMKGGIVAPERLVDIKRLPELTDAISLDGNGITLEALVTLSQIEDDPMIATHLPALADAASLAATPQLRNMATIGGNILQRPRCWYFRNDAVPCWLKGGDTCFAREGQNQHHAIFDLSPCVATHASDPATALLSYSATVRYRDGRGESEITIEEFFQPPVEDRRTENILPEDAIVTGIRIPLPKEGTRSRYLKAMDRKVWAFALAGVAVVLEMDGETVSGAKVTLGGVAPIPLRASGVEDVLTGSVLDEATISRAVDAAVVGAKPLSHNGYKVPLIEALVRDALWQVAEG